MKNRKLLIIPERCKECGLCHDVCPKQILTTENNINSSGYHPVLLSNPDKCSLCGNCILVCPDLAIVYEEAIT